MVRVLSSVIVIAQSDTINVEYVIVWLKKISLEQLLFPTLYSFSGAFYRDFLEKNSLCVL